MVPVGEARRVGDSVLLARRSAGQQDPADEHLCLSKYHAPEIVFGDGSLPEAAHAAVRLGARRPFVVTDPGVIEAGWPTELLARLRAAGLTPVVWTEVTPNPKDHEIEAGYARYLEAGCDVVVGIGGGSVIDAAKGVALLAANGGRILDYEGIDRIEHSIVSLAHGPLTDHHALQAISLVNGNLVHTMRRPGDAVARSFMAQAALEAGLAFTNAILGATHAMSHQVGGLPHGVVNGVLLPHVIRFNGAALPDRFVPIAQAMGLHQPGMPGEEADELVADEVRRLGDEVGVPRGLGALGVSTDDIPRLSELTLGDACLTTNPRPTSVTDVEMLFKAAL